MLPDDLLLRHAPLAPVSGCGQLVAHQAGDVFGLWQAWEAATGLRQDVPFWAVVWPAARVLARWILEGRVDVAGASVLDIGCGGGVVAIAAAVSGASGVLANDIDPVALHVAGRNALANGVRVDFTCRDVLAEPSSVSADLVLVADFFYEKEQAGRTLPALVALRRRGVRVIVADGGRPFAPRSELTLLGRERVEVDPALEGRNDREVRLLEVR